jgi:hypothetical protein
MNEPSLSRSGGLGELGKVLSRISPDKSACGNRRHKTFGQKAKLTPNRKAYSYRSRYDTKE